MTRPKIVQARTTFLTSPITSGVTSITLDNLVDIYGNELSMTDFGDIGYITLDPGVKDSEEICSFTGITANDNGSFTISGVTRALKAKSDYTTGGTARSHSGGSIAVISNNPQIYDDILNYIEQIAVAGAPDASNTAKGIVEIAISSEIDSDEDTGATGAALAITPDQLALSKYGTRLPDETGKVFLNAVTGMIFPYVDSTAPTGFLNADGTAYNNNDYVALALKIKGRRGYNTGTTVTADAGTDTLTATSHGLNDGDLIFFSSTTTLPAGLSVFTPYYVINKTVNTFQVSTSSGGSATNITDAGTGTHSFHTQFKVPDLRGRMILGYSASAPTKTFTRSSRSGNICTVTGVSNTNNNEIQTGQKVRYVSTGTAMTGLTNDTDYYLIRVAYNQFSLATSISNANKGTAISLSGDGTGTHTFMLTFSARAMGDTGGEETHAITQGELAAHSHSMPSYAAGSPSTKSVDTSNGNYNLPTFSTNVDGGSDLPHNNMPLFAVENYIIKT